MDKHLAVCILLQLNASVAKVVMQKIASKYYNTRFIRVFVENTPWLVEKLAIKVLPCVICFVDGVTKDR